MSTDHVGKTAMYSTEPAVEPGDICASGCLVHIRVHGNVSGGAIFRFPERKGGGAVVLTRKDREHLIDLLKSIDSDERRP